MKFKILPLAFALNGIQATKLTILKNHTLNNHKHTFFEYE